MPFEIDSDIDRQTEDKKTSSAFLRQHRKLLRLDTPDDEKKLIRYFTDDMGKTHLRYAQYYQGIPVWPGQFQISLGKWGAVETFSGAYAPSPGREVLDPTVDSYQAMETALEAIADGGRQVDDGSDVDIETELIIFAPGNRPATLAWKFECHISETQIWRVIVDAHANLVIDAYNTVPSASIDVSGTGVLGDWINGVGWREGGAYWLLDKSKPMYNAASDTGVIMTLDANNKEEKAFFHRAEMPTGPWVPDGLDLHQNMSLTYDYFYQNHNWTAFDNNGHDIIGITRFGTNSSNAGYSMPLKTMIFGDARPFAADLGVVAHEFTHGITGETSNLIYRDQSGAANEAMSDIFAVAVDAWAKGAINWVVGYISFAETGGLRFLKYPGAFEIIPGHEYVYPRTMSEYMGRNHPFWTIYGHDDKGGVHINNMIIGHAFYLLAEGMPDAIGLEKAAAIFFRANTIYLMEASQFAHVRDACVDSARDLYGSASPEVVAVGRAFDAVEIYGPEETDESRRPGDPGEVPYVDGPDNDIFLFSTFMGNFLGRREAALHDPAHGSILSSYPAAMVRPSVSRDGSMVCYVTNDFDLAIQTTDGNTPAGKLGFAGRVYSTAMSPDANRYAFVLMDGMKPSNTIIVVDVQSGEAVEHHLLDQLIGAPPIDSIQFAEIMTFTANGRFLIYDAFSVFDIDEKGQIGAWAVYALDFETGANHVLVASDRGLQIGNPSLANSTNDLMVIDVYDPASNLNTIVAMNLLSGANAEVFRIKGMIGVPAYSGDDRAVVFNYPNPSTLTGSSLVVQPLAVDRITPSGDAQWHLNEGFAGVIYRRGAYDAPDPVISLSHDHLSFGEVIAGQSAHRTILISNTGYSSLEIYEASISGPQKEAFTTTGTCVGAHLPRDAQCSMAVRFFPDKPVGFNAQIAVYSNDTQTPIARIAVSGTGQENGDELDSNDEDGNGKDGHNGNGYKRNGNAADEKKERGSGGSGCFIKSATIY